MPVYWRGYREGLKMCASPSCGNDMEATDGNQVRSFPAR